MHRHRVQEHMGVAVYTPEESLTILVGLLVTWGLGLLPAWMARYWWKRAPLSNRAANWIAGLSCLFFAIAFAILRFALGEANPGKISPVWMFVFFAQRWIMTRGKKSGEELASGLRKMIADPATTEERRALAREKLAQLEAKILKHAPQQRLATAGGPQIAEQGQPAGHPLRAANSTLDHDDVAGRVEPRTRPPRSSAQEPESWRRYGRLAAYAVAIVVALDIVLMVSGYRVLVHERIVQPGERFEVEGWTFGSFERPVVLCRYWTGRSLKLTSRVYGTSEGESDECRFLYAPQKQQVYDLQAQNDLPDQARVNPVLEVLGYGDHFTEGRSPDSLLAEIETQGQAELNESEGPIQPSSRAVLAPSVDTKFARVRLPKSVAIDVPRDWWVLDERATSWIKSNFESALELSGLTVPDDQEVDLIRANSLPTSTYAALAVTSAPSDRATRAEVRSLSSADLAMIDRQLRDEVFPGMLSAIGQKLLDYNGSRLTTISSHPAIVTEYRRTGPRGPVVVQLNRIFTGTQEIAVNLSYREAEAARWRPVIARIRQSVSITG